MEMRTICGPHCLAARSLFPDDQDPDPGACGLWVLWKDGRKQVASHVPPGPNPHEITQKRMTTLRPCQILQGWCECHMPQWPANSSGIQQGSYKNIRQFAREEDALIARVLRSQGRYSARFSVTRPETPGAGAGMMLWDGRLSAHLTYRTLSSASP